MLYHIRLLFTAFVFTLIGQNIGVVQMLNRNAEIEKQEKYRLTFIEQEELIHKYDVAVKAEEKVVAALEEKKEQLLIESLKAEIVKIKKYYFLIKHPDGRYELRTGGTPSWRYNNPGKLLNGNFSKQMGSIGSDGKLAVFPTYADGRVALDIYLFSSDFGYKEKTLSEAIKQFAPVKDGYNPTAYLASITKKTGISSSKRLSDMTIDEREALLDAIESYEGFIQGNVKTFKDEDDFKKNGY